mgnify:CR=1 FL=1
MPEIFDPIPPALRSYLERLRRETLTLAKNANSESVSVYREYMAKLKVYDMLLSPELGGLIKDHMDGNEGVMQAVKNMEIG